MYLQFTNADGQQHEVMLTGRTALTFGRSPEADISIPDAKISRIHAEIRVWDSDFVIKDMGSRNGFTVNGVRTEVAILKAGDLLRIGSYEFTVEKSHSKGAMTIVREVTKELEESPKGYRTVLREIVQSTAPTPRRK